MTFDEADKVVHSVETQWHYDIMVSFGFQPLTKEGIGFVRSYDYQNSNGYRMRVTTGYSSDRWEDLQSGKVGYWSSLKDHLEKLKGEQ